MVQAQLEGKVPDPNRVGVILAAVSGHADVRGQLRGVRPQGSDRVSPFLSDVHRQHGPGLVSMRYGLKGRLRDGLRVRIVGPCDRESYNLIRAGTADAMVTGGSEAAITD